jgi:hypothetical protein
MIDLTLPASVAVLPVEPAHTHDPITMALEIGQSPGGDVIPPGAKIIYGANPTPSSLDIGQNPGGGVIPPVLK